MSEFPQPPLPENDCPTDNCPDVYNPDQTDLDGDGIGDACDTDLPRAWYVAIDGSDDTGDGTYDFPFATIKHAANLAQSLDTVIVKPGVYNGIDNIGINFEDKILFIISESGPEVTTINGYGLDTPGFSITGFSSEDSLSVIEGFSFIGFNGGMFSSAIVVLSNSPQINNCHFTNCNIPISAVNSKAYIMECVFTNCTSTAIYLEDGACMVKNCLIADNSGTGISFVHASQSSIYNTSIIGNDIGIDYQVFMMEDTQPLTDSSIIAFNRIGLKADGLTYYGDLNCSDVYGNTELDYSGTIPDQTGTDGNISQDPLLCDTASMDFHIMDSSPCAPSNNSCGSLMGAFGVGCSAPYNCGDANSDNIIDISDAVYLINFVYLNGPNPNPIISGDTNCDGSVDISDAFYLILYSFENGHPPCDIDGDGVPDC